MNESETEVKITKKAYCRQKGGLNVKNILNGSREVDANSEESIAYSIIERKLGLFKTSARGRERESNRSCER